MSAIKKVNKKYTCEEYFKFEKKSETRHEFYYGEIFSMAGGTKKQNKICGRLFILFENAFSDKNSKKIFYFNKQSLKYYLLVSQNKILVECYKKEETKWIYSYYNELNQIIKFDDFGFEIIIRNIYK